MMVCCHATKSQLFCTKSGLCSNALTMPCQSHHKTWCDVTVTSVSALSILICSCTGDCFQAYPFFYWKTSLCSKNSIVPDRLRSLFLGRKLIFQPSRKCLYFQRCVEKTSVVRAKLQSVQTKRCLDCAGKRWGCVCLNRMTGEQPRNLPPSKHWSQCWISPRHWKLKILLLHAELGTRFQAY